MRLILPTMVVVVALCVIAMVALTPPPSFAQSDPLVGTGGVAVIDLDVIAKKLGRADTIAAEITAKQTELNNQLTQAQEQVKAQLEAKQAELGQTPTAEQTRQLQQMRSQAGTRLIQAQRQAQQLLQQHRVAVINKFRDEVKPFAQAVARKRGYLVVLIRNDQFIYTYAASVDITDSVAAKMAE